ncbi:MAG: BatA domain-containing protein [Pirellulaceae bacterium]
MTFLHLSLLLGAGLGLAPILFHLMAKRPPKRIVFPALRFVRKTQIDSNRGWRVQHWLLLALRVLLIGLLALLLAGPRVSSNLLTVTTLLLGGGVLALLMTAASWIALARRRPLRVLLTTSITAGILWALVAAGLGWMWLNGTAPPMPNPSGPIATAFLIDSSPSMDYRHLNKTRLQEATETAQWLIDRMPPESQAALIGGEGLARLSSDRITLKRQLERLSVDGQAVPMPQRIAQAVDLVRQSDLDRKEIYVLSDLSASSWSIEENQGLAQLLAKEPPVLLQLVDLGMQQPTNLGIRSVTLSSQSVATGGMVEIQASLQAEGPPPSRQATAELYQEPIDATLPRIVDGKLQTPEPKLVDRQTVEVQTGTPGVVRFVVRDLQAGTHHLELRLANPDPLEIDNRYPVSVVAGPQGRSLFVARDPQQAMAAAATIDPQAGQSLPDSSSVLTDYFQLDIAELSSYRAVMLIDPADLPESSVKRLSDYVEQGGSLLIGLGPAAGSAEILAKSPLAKLLPGVPARIVRRPDDAPAFLQPAMPSHPIFFPFDSMLDQTPWNLFDTYRFWEFDRLNPGAAALVQFSPTGQAAMIEQPRGTGRIITITTPLPEEAYPEGRSPWNQLWSGPDAWPAYALLLGTVQYLSGQGRERFNVPAGTPMVLANDPATMPQRYDLFTPQAELIRAESQDGNLPVPSTRRPGHYRLRGIKDGKTLLRGFSTYIPDDSLTLQRTTTEQLDEILGKETYLLAKDRDALTHSIGAGRFGRELYPYLMLILAAFLIAEQAIASRFYQLGTARSSRQA